jgi:drug/metabolite transporter (DMT)-like permease
MSALLACVAGAFFAINIVAIRRGLDHTGIRTDVAAFVTIVISVIASGVAALLGGVRPGDVTWDDTRGFLLVGSLVPGIGQLTFYSAIRMIGPARSSVIIGTVPVWSVVLATIFLDESWSVAVAAGTALTVAGGVLLAYQPALKGRASMIGVGAALTTALLFGTRDVVARSVTQDSDLHSSAAAFAMLLAGGVVLFIGAMIMAGPTVIIDNTRRGMRHLLIPGIAVGLATVALLAAFVRGRVGIVSPLNTASQSVAVLILASVVFGRTEVNRRIIIAVAFVLVGGTIIGVTR